MCDFGPILGDPVAGKPGYFKVIGWHFTCRVREEWEIWAAFAEREEDDYLADLEAERCMQHDSDVDAFLEGQLDEIPEATEIQHVVPEWEGDDVEEVFEDEQLVLCDGSAKDLREMEERGLSPSGFSIIGLGSEGVPDDWAYAC